MNINRNLSEIKAEVLLNYLYPEMNERWVAQYEGAFYRNYNNDPMNIDEQTGEVKLSRDGFVRLLPQGLLNNENDLIGREDKTEKVKEIEHRQRVLRAAFMPFDTYAFRKRLVLERQASDLLSEKLNYVLKAYFDFDMSKEKSELVKETACMLPFICRYKGDMHFLTNLLATLTGYRVTMRTGRYSETDTTDMWLPYVKYEILIPSLSTEAYQEKYETLKPLIAFLKEWFIPFDIHCDIVIKEHGIAQHIGERLTLDYNTELNQ